MSPDEIKTKRNLIANTKAMEVIAVIDNRIFNHFVLKNDNKPLKELMNESYNYSDTVSKVINHFKIQGWVIEFKDNNYIISYPPDLISIGT
jgi:hypothetical protein